MQCNVNTMGGACYKLEERRGEGLVVINYFDFVVGVAWIQKHGPKITTTKQLRPLR